MSSLVLPAQVAPIEMPAVDWAATAPLWIVFAGACVSVLLEAFLPRHQRWPVQVLLTGLTLVAALVALAGYALGSPAAVLTFGTALSVDAPALFLWGTLIVLAIPSLLLIADRSVERAGCSSPRPPSGPRSAPAAAPPPRSAVSTSTAPTGRPTRHRRCRPSRSRSCCSRSAA